jgi:hypothetical protein
MAITLNAAATSNRDWKTQFQFTDAETDELLDFTDAFIAIAIEDANGCQIHLSTTDNGEITLISTGIIELDIGYADMSICEGTYLIGGYYQLNGETIDLFEGTLAVRRGIPKP